MKKRRRDEGSEEEIGDESSKDGDASGGDENGEDIGADTIARGSGDGDSGTEEDDDGGDGLGGIDVIAQNAAEEIEASIGFFDPVPEDLSSIEQLLVNSGKGSYGTIDVHSLATTICAQTRVGTVVRLEDDPECIGFISCLNWHQHRDLLKPLRTTLFTRATNNEIKSVQKYLPKFDDGATGFLVCERVMNFPPELIPKLQEAIFDEIAWATEDEPTEEFRNSFKLKHFFYTTEAMMSSTGSSTKRKSKKKQKKHKKKKKMKVSEEVAEGPPEFMRPEDDIIYKHAELTVSYAIPGQIPIKGGLIRRRLAIFFLASAVPKIREETAKLIADGTRNS